MMKLTRRDLLASAALSGSVLGTAGCLSLPTGERGPHVNFSGNVSTDEPLVEDAELSTDAAYPNHYSALIDTDDAAETIRWEYVREEIPLLINTLEETDYGSEYLAFFGMALPGTKQLQPGDTSRDDGTVRFAYRVDRSGSAAWEVEVNTHIRRVESDDAPDDPAFEVQF